MDKAVWTNQFLQVLAQCGVAREAARAAGVATTTVAARRKIDPDFEEAYLQALEDSVDLLDSAVRSRALHGIEEPVIYQGQLTPVWEVDADGQPLVDDITGRMIQARNPDGSLKYLTVTKYSDALAMFVLKGNRRRIYGDKTEVMGENGGAIKVDEVKKTSRIAALLAMARERKDIA
jgi:hypothetical protein